jgi:hypothetical protein
MQGRGVLQIEGIMRIADLNAALKSEYFSHYNLAKILPFFAINQ